MRRRKVLLDMADPVEDSPQQVPQEVPPAFDPATVVTRPGSAKPPTAAELLDIIRTFQRRCTSPYQQPHVAVDDDPFSLGTPFTLPPQPSPLPVADWLYRSLGIPISVYVGRTVGTDSVAISGGDGSLGQAVADATISGGVASGTITFSGLSPQI